MEGPVEDAPVPPQVQPTPVPAPPTPPPPKPVVQRPQPPAPTPKPVAQRPQPAKPSPANARPAPAKAAPVVPAQAAARPAARPTGRLSGLLTGISDRETESRATAPPAKAAGPAVQASLAAEIRRQLKPHWKAPTGADVELLRTQVTVTLAPNGSVASIGDVRTTGETPSNRSQVKLHQEQAVRAVRLAAPFRLPADFYDAWKVIRPTFDRRLSQ
jgi:outer membrane biosynthesis protein TonB